MSKSITTSPSVIVEGWPCSGSDPLSGIVCVCGLPSAVAEWADAPPVGAAAAPSSRDRPCWISANRSSASSALTSASTVMACSRDSRRVRMSSLRLMVVISLRSTNAPTSNRLPNSFKQATRLAGGNSSSSECCTSCCTSRAFSWLGVRCFSASIASLYASTSCWILASFASTYGAHTIVLGAASFLYAPLYASAFV